MLYLEKPFKVCVAITDELKLVHFFFGNGRQIHYTIFSQYLTCLLTAKFNESGGETKETGKASVSEGKR